MSRAPWLLLVACVACGGVSAATDGPRADAAVTLDQAQSRSDLSPPFDLAGARDSSAAPLDGTVAVKDMASAFDAARVDSATPVSSWTVSAFGSGLGGSLSTGTGFILEGAVGLPGPRGGASSSNFSVEPVIPARR